MYQKATSKLLRAVLIAAVLVIALVSGGALDKSIHVDAKSCDEAFTDYMNANNTFEIARQSYFYGIPSTCQQDCALDPNFQQCVSNCQTDRYTTLGQADLAMFSMALDTCEPLTLDACAQARAMADDCLSLYDPSAYSDPAEASAVADQRAA
jgi:hypothetical protein